MCGRFTQQRPTSELAQIFGAEDRVMLPGGHFNVAPTQDAAVVVQREEQRAVVAYRWGLVPHWARDLKVGSRMFNARSETVATSPAFRDSLARRRCIVPADSFYEWKREGTTRQPYRILREDEKPLALAGLWSGWKDPASGEWTRTFTIITGDPNEVVSDLHDRMPVVLPDGAWERWLDPAFGEPGELLTMLQEPWEELSLVAYPVTTAVNNVRLDGPALIEPLGKATEVAAAAATARPSQPGLFGPADADPDA